MLRTLQTIRNLGNLGIGCVLISLASSAYCQSPPTIPDTARDLMETEQSDAQATTTKLPDIESTNNPDEYEEILDYISSPTPILNNVETVPTPNKNSSSPDQNTLFDHFKKFVSDAKSDTSSPQTSETAPSAENTPAAPQPQKVSINTDNDLENLLDDTITAPMLAPCIDYDKQLLDCTQTYCELETPPTEFEYGSIKKIVGIDSKNTSICQIQEFDASDQRMTLDCRLSPLSRQVASQYFRAPTNQIKLEYERILYNECRIDLGDGKLIKHNDKLTVNLPVLPSLLPGDNKKKEVVKENNFNQSSTTTAPAHQDKITLPKAQIVEHVAIVPIFKPQLPVTQPLGQIDQDYLDLLQEKKESLPEEKRIHEKHQSALSNIEENFKTQHVPEKKTKHFTINREKNSASASTPKSDEPTGSEKKSSKVQLTIRDSKTVPNSLQVNRTLSQAYNALISGQISAAIRMYKDILDVQPYHLDALFGLATAYHRNYQYEQARKIYVDILEIDPNHKEALNNFLVLIAEESPEDALLELQKLERINPRFSPIPAQIAMIYLKLGKTAQAEQHLRRAVKLSPSNTVYIYNLAIVLDKLGKYDMAIPLYKKVLSAAEIGQNIPGSIQRIQERVIFLEQK